MANRAPSDPRLGLRGLAEVVDLVDSLRHEISGIHIVITDRPESVRSAVAARLPEGYELAELADETGISSIVEHPPGDGDAVRGRVLVVALDPRADEWRPALDGLNLRREWLLAPRNHAVVMAVGRTLDDADSAYLALQNRAPDFWSFRTRVYRAGGPDDNPATRERLLETATTELGAEGRARVRTLDVDADWEPWRLWRAPSRVRAWLEQASPAAPRSMHVFEPKLILERPAESVFQPQGPAVPRARWPEPHPPARLLDSAGQVLVDAAHARLRRDGYAYLFELPEDPPQAMTDAVATAVLVYRSAYPGVVQLDLSHGMAGAVAHWLREAGADQADIDAVDPENALARLAGALGEERPLIALTNATDIDADRARSVLVPLGCVLLASVRPIRRADFAVCHPRDLGERAQWCATELFGWSGHPRMLAFDDSRDFALVMRRALATARHVVVLPGPVDASDTHGWHLAETHAERMAGIYIGDQPVPNAAISWTRLDPDNEPHARATFSSALRALAGPPTSEPHAAGADAPVPGTEAEAIPPFDHATLESVDEVRAWLDQMLDVNGEDLDSRIQAVLDTVLAVGEQTAFSPLGRVLAEHLERTGTPAIARALEPKLPEHSVGLREVQRWVYETLLRVLPEQDDDEATRAERVRLLNNLGRALSDLGQLEQARGALREAVDICRKLSGSWRAFYLATSLSHLGYVYSKLGQPEQAMRVTRMAVDINRKLSEARPDVFLSDLALSLNNLGNSYSELGQPEQAMAAIREAVDIYRKLSEARPDAFLPDLAASLNNLGKVHSELGEPEQTMAATREAVDIYRRLSEARPDAFLPDLAMSLNNLASSHNELEQPEPAMAAMQEAVDIYRKLSEARPDVFLPDLAMSLNGLGYLHDERGQLEQAVAVTREALGLYCELFPRRPAVFADDLEGCAENLAAYLDVLGQDPDEDLDLVQAAALLDAPLSNADSGSTSAPP